MINTDFIMIAEVDIISAGVVGLIALAVMVFAILAAKTWHWINVVLLILTMIAAIMSIVGMTYVFAYRRDAMLDLNKQTLAAMKAEQELEEIKVGDPLSPRYESGSLRALANEFSRTMVGRGRAFRNGSITAGDENQRVFTFPEGKARDLDQDASLQSAVLYVFADTEVGPTRYIGTVQVAAEDGKTLTLNPMEIVDVPAYTEPAATWTLFEKMPQDESITFRNAIVSRLTNSENLNEVQQKLLDNLSENQLSELDLTTFRSALAEWYLSAESMGMRADSPKYESLLDRFTFDRQALGRIDKWISNAPNRISNRFEPQPEEIFVKVVFTEDSDDSVQVDGVGNLESIGLYDGNGRAIASRLKQDGEGAIQFKKGDTIFVDKPTWLGYRVGETTVRSFEERFQGKIEQQGEYFRRALIDFPLTFKNLALEATQTLKETQKVVEANEQTRAAFADAQSQIRVRTDLINQNEQDREKLESDLLSVRNSNASKMETLNALKNRIATIESEIAAAYRRAQNDTLQRLRTAVSTQ